MNQKVMLITGATSGIGKAVALRAAKEGMKLILTGRRENLLADLVKDIGKDNAIAISADATQFEEQAKVVEAGVAHWGQLDIAFADAGTGISQPGTERDLSRYIHVFCSYEALISSKNLSSSISSGGPEFKPSSKRERKRSNLALP